VPRFSGGYETEYQLTRPIPSVFLDKDTVGLVEAFLIERGSQLDPPRSRREALWLSVMDSSGTSRLQTIKDYPFRNFDEGIESLFVSYGVFGEALSISVNFARPAAESHVAVNYRGPGAREVSERLAEGVVRLLGDARTGNWLYHPGPLIRGALTALFLGTVGILLGAFIAYRAVLAALLPLVILLYSYLYLAPMFNPYTIFDTPRNRASRGWITPLTWAILAVLSIWFVASLISGGVG
jgi:hypothetical protein